MSAQAREQAPAQGEGRGGSEAASGKGGLLLLPLATSTLLNPINTTVISVALIPIGKEFGARTDRTVWLVSGLYLASAIGQPVLGLLVDRLGARRTLVYGSLITLVAGLVALLPVSFGWLVGVRLAIGIGTSAGFPAAMAVLRRQQESEGLDPGGARRALAVLAVCSQAVAAVGPTLGGLLILCFGWQAVFVVNAPLAALVLILTLALVPRESPDAGERQPADVAGVALFCVALLAVMLLLSDPTLGLLWLLAPAAAACAALVRVERRAVVPFLRLGPAATVRPILRTYLRQTLVFVPLYATVFGYVQWLETTRHLGDTAAGLVLLPLSGTAMLLSSLPLRGRARPRLALSAVLLVLGTAMLFVLGSATPWAVLLIVGVVFGAVQGLVSLANQNVLYRQAAPGTIGTASGLYRTAQFLGAIAASTLIGICFRDGATSHALHTLALVLAVFAIATLLVTLPDRAIDAESPSQG